MSMVSFFDLYTLHNSTDKIGNEFRKDSQNKICRFCGKSSPDVSFETIPHIIPELLGRNKVTSNFECDYCNAAYKAHEADTATMLQHYLSLLNIKSKKGVPAFQSKKDIGEFSTTLKNRHLSFGLNTEDYQFDYAEKKITVNFRTKHFRPFSVYKVFLKMGISLLTDEELSQNKHYLDFLNSEIPIENGMQVWTAFRYMFKTKYHLTPKVNLYKANNTLVGKCAYPEYVLLINFSNIVIQFFLPISNQNMEEHTPENKLQLELFPAFVLDDIQRLNKIDVYHFDLKETKKISITDTVVLYYDALISNDKID